MEDFSTCLGISWTCSLICCMIWIFSPAEGKPMMNAVGSKVILHCGNDTINTLNQLTWKMNGDLLFSFSPSTHRYISNKTLNLNINVSESESQFALIIESAQTAHTGNYTCETTYTDKGAEKLQWELIITGPEEGDNWKTRQKWEKIVIAVAVPCVCLLILIISLVIQRTVCTKCRKNRSHSSCVEREQTEDIYENCLEAHLSQQRGYTRPHQFKARGH